MPDLVNQLSALLISKNMRLVTAESCTGGLVSASLTQKAGASKFFERGFVTYSNEAKNESIGVDLDTINTHGAVSSQTAEAMAKGALENSKADIAVSITGVAGPDGGTDEKPVGLVYFGFSVRDGETKTIKKHLKGNRLEIQAQASIEAIEQLISTLKEQE